MKSSPILSNITFKSQSNDLSNIALLTVIMSSPTGMMTSTVAGLDFVETSTTLTATTSGLGSGPSATATPPTMRTDKLSGKPLNSMPVQLVLGFLGMCLFTATIIRCYNVSRRNHAILMRERGQQDIEARRQRRQRRQLPQQRRATNVAGTSQAMPSYDENEPYPHHRRQQPLFLMVSETGASVAMTERSTLAARLRAYREMAAYRSGRVGLPSDNGIGTRLTELEETMPQSNVVAPAYHEDVSPPSFLATVGKPPSYEDSFQQPLPPTHSGGGGGGGDGGRMG